MALKTRPYRCPGCDREAYVYVNRTTLHSYGNNGLVYTISCHDSNDNSDHRLANPCLGEWFQHRPFQTETNAISEWNTAIIEMAAAALGITPKQARALKEGRATIQMEQSHDE